MDNQLNVNIENHQVDRSDELNPGEMMTDALHFVNHTFALVYEQCKISYADFLTHLQAHDPDAASSLQRLWDEVDSDIFEKYASLNLSRFAFHRWQNALNEWKDNLLSALYEYLNQNNDYSFQEFVGAGYIEAA